MLILEKSSDEDTNDDDDEEVEDDDKQDEEEEKNDNQNKKCKLFEFFFVVFVNYLCLLNNLRCVVSQVRLDCNSVNSPKVILNELSNFSPTTLQFATHN